MEPEILIIEDNEQNFYLMEYLLVRNGFRVTWAKDGYQALELAAKSTPAAVILDIQLPRMDGYQVARRLKEQPGLSRVPIIAVTSYAMPGDREKAIKAGADGYIEKPIDPETFVSQIKKYIESMKIKGGEEDEEDIGG